MSWEAIGSLSCAIATLIASVIALFKENILSWIRKPKITNNLKSLTFKEDLESEEESNAETTVNKASCYSLVLKVSNTGNQDCENIEFLLKSLDYRETPSYEYKSLEQIPDKPLWLNSSKETSKNLRANGGECKIQLIRIYAPNRKKQSKTQSPSSTPGFSIGNISLSDNKIKKGCYKATFEMYSKNYKKITYVVEFEWDATWQWRIADMQISNFKVYEV